MTVAIETEDPGWDNIGLEKLAGQALAGVCSELGLDPALCELSILGCNDARIAVLNGEFRDKPSPTNVLSWPAEERGADVPGGVPSVPVADIFGAIELGDLAIALETCRREADEQQKDVEAHVLHLLVHGILHLCGYDHICDEDAELMESCEIRILEKQGFANPYEI